MVYPYCSEVLKSIFLRSKSEEGGVFMDKRRIYYLQKGKCKRQISQRAFRKLLFSTVPSDAYIYDISVRLLERGEKIRTREGYIFYTYKGYSSKKIVL